MSNRDAFLSGVATPLTTAVIELASHGDGKRFLASLLLVLESQVGAFYYIEE